MLGPILIILYTKPLSGVIDCHSVPHHRFADDTGLCKSETRDNTDSVLTTQQTAVKRSKTEALLIDSSKFPSHPESNYWAEWHYVFRFCPKPRWQVGQDSVNESTGTG